MVKIISHLRLRLLKIEEGRTDSVQAIIQERGPVRCGSLVTMVRKCGKPTCHCNQGKGHASAYLSTKKDGKTRMIYIPADCLEEVSRHARSYQRLRKHRARLAKLTKESLQIIDLLQKALSCTGPFHDAGRGAVTDKNLKSARGQSC